MQQKQQGLLKKLIILLIIAVIAVGVYFGNKFYTASKNLQSGGIQAQNTNPERTPFQTRTATSGEVVVTENTPGEEILNPASTTQATSFPLAKPRLQHLWTEPVSGFDFIVKDREVISTSTATTTVRISIATTTESNATTTLVATTTVVYKTTILKNEAYIYLWDRATGHIYQNLASTTENERFSNYTLPAMEEVYFVDPLTVLARGLDDSNESVQSTYLKLFKDSSTSTIYSATEKTVPINSKFISYSNELKKIFFFVDKTGQGIVANADLSSFLRVISTTLTEWIPQFVNKSTLAATTKPSAYFQGYLFFLNNSSSGTNEYILGEKYGFTTLVSPDGKKVLYSEIAEDLLQTSIYDIKSGKIVALTQSTLSEKCTWTADSKKIYCAIPQRLAFAPYPDDWYQGKSSFSDNIWSVDPATGEFKVIVALQDQVTDPIDAYNVKVSADDKYLLFQDKYSLTLWKYDL